ncbi:hypothetical protein V2E24_02855 [Mycoplasmopsis ciconiae]|uniref:Lipoprotein n=1 Tax=Mycoplasmopsis ciconiae TaxID=561067 RepID=A0ABU7MLV9_9BACT|nr:hypothetical protein [Mycoplasmopsis ciconiae]
MKKIFKFLSVFTATPLFFIFSSCNNNSTQLKIKNFEGEKKLNSQQLAFILNNFEFQNLIDKKTNNLFEQNQNDSILYPNFSWERAFKKQENFEKLSNNQKNKVIEKEYSNLFYLDNFEFLLYKIYDQYNFYKDFIPNLIDIKQIRLLGFYYSDIQQKLLSDIMLLNLKAYANFPKNIKSIRLQNLTYNLENNYIKFSIHFYDQDHKNITPSQYKDNTYTINNFFKYSDFNRNYKFINLSDKLQFNEFIPNPTLKIDYKNYYNPFNYQEYDSLVDGSNLITSKYFNYLLNKYPEWFYIPIPDYLKDVVQEFKIYQNHSPQEQYANLTNPFEQISKIYVQVIYKNTDSQTYEWNSIDFNRHYHLFKGYLNQENKIQTYLNSENLDKGQNLDDFLEENMQNLIDKAIKQLENNLSIWNNQKMNQIEAYEALRFDFKGFSFIEDLLNNYMSDYLINNTQNNFYTGIKYLKINKHTTNNPGALNIKIDFYDFDNNLIKTSKNHFLIKNFKGYLSDV